MELKPVIIVWDDAHGGFDDMSHSEMANMEPVRTWSIGYVVTRNSKGIVTTTDLWKDEELKDSASNYGFIPNGMIVEIIELQVPHPLSLVNGL